MNIESYKHSNTEIEEYLSHAITSYGIVQLQGNKPYKLYSCIKDDGGNIIGAVMGDVTENLCFISHVYVEESKRNQGLGKKLLSIIESEAIKSGCDTLRLNTFNPESHTFYEDAGFTETTCIKDYMNGFDLVYYHKSIH